MKIFLQLFFVTLLLTNSCTLDTSDRYKDTMNETLNPLSGKIKEVQNIDDVEDMGGCQFLIELNPWSKKSSKWGLSITRRNVWKDGRINNYGLFGLDESSKLLGKYHDDKHHLIYIGPWQLSKPINKQIRFYAYYSKNGGEISYQFESMNDKNKGIPQKSFNLIPNSKYPPDKFGLCVTKWIANHGYNAISEVKSKNPFSKNYLMPTGNVIEVDE